MGSAIARGGRVNVPKGIYLVSDTIVVKTYVRLVGENDNAVKIKASPAFPTDGRPVIQIGPGAAPTNDVYASAECLRVECSNLPNVIGIRLDDVNEKGGLFRVEVRQVAADVGIDIVNCAHACVEKVGVVGKTVAIRCHSLAGPVWFRDISLSTAAGGPGTDGIRVENGTVSVFNLHVERVEYGIDFAGPGVYGGAVIGARGHTSVTAVVNIAAGTSARPFYAHVANSGKYSVRDAVLGRAYKGDVVMMEPAPVPAWDSI